MVVPAGQHTIEFRFEPESYTQGNTVTMIASLIAFALLAAAIFMQVRKKKPN
jgi:LPXTG-motif cell wall-anchored protein